MIAVIKSGGSAAVIVVLAGVVVKLHKDHREAQAQLLAQAKEHAQEILRLRGEYDAKIERITDQRIEELGTVTAALGTVTSLASTLAQSQSHSMNPTPIPPPPRRTQK